MIKVCDSMMGSGKSSAAINHMNDHPDQRFIYITPYIEETQRIAAACPALNFVEPSNTSPRFKFSKLVHTAQLLADGRNITTTHAAFQLYTDEMLESIRAGGYTLICDEAVDVMTEVRYNTADIEVLVNGGYLKKLDDDTYEVGEREYGDGDAFADFFAMLKYRDVVALQDKKPGRISKFYDTNCLLEQDYVKDSSLKAGKYLESVAKECNVPFKVKSFVKFEKGEGLQKKEEDFAAEIDKLVKGN